MVFTSATGGNKEYIQELQSLRLARLKQVRLQEKNISKERCTAYKNVIIERKIKKTSDVKSEQLIQKQVIHDNLVYTWQSSLVDTGNAHRNATTESISNLHEIDKILDIEDQRAKASLKRGNHALRLLAETHNKSYHNYSDYRRECWRNMSISDREDAVLAAEAREARNAARLRLSKSHYLNEVEKYQKTCHALINQGADRVEERRNVNVVAQVTRHASGTSMKGGELNNSKYLAVTNTAKTAEKETFKRHLSMVLKEMMHRKNTAFYAKKARKSVVEKQQVNMLESDLALLSMIDSAAVRSSNLKSASQVAVRVSTTNRHHEAQMEFEDIFIANQSNNSNDNAKTSVSNTNRDLYESQQVINTVGEKTHTSVLKADDTNQFPVKLIPIGKLYFPFSCFAYECQVKAQYFDI